MQIRLCRVSERRAVYGKIGRCTYRVELLIELVLSPFGLCSCQPSGVPDRYVADVNGTLLLFNVKPSTCPTCALRDLTYNLHFEHEIRSPKACGASGCSQRGLCVCVFANLSQVFNQVYRIQSCFFHME